VKDESGQSVIEAIFLGALFLIPVMWGLTVLSDLHAGALAATAAAREGGMDAARANDPAAAAVAIRGAVAAAFDDQGLDPGDVEVAWTLPPGMARGGAVEVLVRYPVSVAAFPLLGELGAPVVWVRAAHIARVDVYRSRE